MLPIILLVLDYTEAEGRTLQRGGAQSYCCFAGSPQAIHFTALILIFLVYKIGMWIMLTHERGLWDEDEAFLLSKGHHDAPSLTDVQ